MPTRHPELSICHFFDKLGSKSIPKQCGNNHRRKQPIWDFHRNEKRPVVADLNYMPQCLGNCFSAQYLLARQSAVYVKDIK